MFTPEIKIGNVSIVGHDFVWRNIVGTRPYMGSFSVRKEVSRELEELENPVNITYRLFGGVSAPISELNFTIQNVFLHDPRPANEFEVIWQYSDIRFLFRGEKMYYAYNVTRLNNARGVDIGGAGETNPAVVRRQYLSNTFKTGRYVRGSVKENGDPFTISEIIEKEIEKINRRLRITGQPSLLFVKKLNVNQGDYIVENMQESGVGVYSGLDRLLKMSRLEMGIRDDSTLTLFSVDFPDQSQIDLIEFLSRTKSIKPHRLYKQDLRKVRPKKIIISFEIMEEILCKDTPVSSRRNTEILERSTSRSTSPSEIIPDGPFVTDARIRSRKIIPCINVIRVPFSIIQPNGEPFFNVGEYVPISTYLESLGSSEEEIRNLWWRDNFLIRIRELLRGGTPTGQDQESLGRKIVSEIRNSYRQLFQIDPAIFDDIDSWQAKRVAVIDAFSGYRPPSPVFQDYAIVPTVRNPEVVRERFSNFVPPRAIKNWLVDVEDPNRQFPTLPSIIIEEQSLGVFRAVFPHDVSTVIQHTIPSGIDPEIAMAPEGTTLAGLSQFLINQNIRLREKFTFEAMISVVWLFNPIVQLERGDTRHPKRYHLEEIDFSSFPLGGAEGPDIEISTKREFARVDFNNNIVNIEIISALARTLAAKAMNVFINRTVGIVEIGGKEDIDLDGNMNFVEYRFNAHEGMVTKVDMLQIPPDPEIIQILPDHVRRYLFAQLDRGGP